MTEIDSESGVKPGPAISFDFSTWYARHSLVPALFALALVLYGFYTSLGGRRVFSDSFLDTEGMDGR